MSRFQSELGNLGRAYLQLTYVFNVEHSGSETLTASTTALLVLQAVRLGVVEEVQVAEEELAAMRLSIEFR